MKKNIQHINTALSANHPMIDWTDNDFFVNKILSEIQTLEDLGGPDTLAHYIVILEVVKADIEQRLDNAKARIANGEE